jgi:glycosyltransferase involved in cell wall biosynthesis
MAARLAAQVLVTDAQAMRRYYLERYGRDSRCIPYGAPVVDSADLSSLAARGLQEGGYHLVVCRLEPENNVDTIVREFVASGSSRELVIVGSTNYRTRYHRHLRDLATPKVRFFGAVYGSELEALRVGAFSYIHGHEVGGTNPSLLEAMGCGNRVLALDTEFNREALADTGYYWTAEDGSLASLIEGVEGSAEEGARLGARTRRRIMDAYTWDRVAADHHRMLGET